MDAKDRRIAELERENDELKETIKSLLARIEELERRLALNSNNSSKPPSSDGLRKQSKNRSLRETGNKKFGGQVGHVGDTLKQVENPDIVKEYDSTTCAACGDSLAESPVEEVIEKQEVDVVIKKQIIAHKASIRVCKCGTKNTHMPKHMKAPVQYSANIRAIGVYLGQQFIPKDRTSDVFRDIFGVEISDTTLMKFDEECAEKLIHFNKAALEAIKKATVKYMDESGIRIMKKTEWVHVISTALLTHYRIDPKRGSLLEGIIGKIIHDHWKPYFTLEDVLHALCNAHHLRELKALIEIEKEVWAKEMFELLKNTSRLENPTAEQQQAISDQYDQIVVKGLAHHVGLGQLKPNSTKKRVGHNLLIRLRDFKTETLRFLYDSEIPFTNNLAERDIRLVKLKQKVSGGFRTHLGAEIFVAIRSLVSTVQKQGKSIFQYLIDIFNDCFDLHSLIPDAAPLTVDGSQTDKVNPPGGGTVQAVGMPTFITTNWDGT
jgi:transposase